MVRRLVGAIEGIPVGRNDGEVEGLLEGCVDGNIEGAVESVAVGQAVGMEEGTLVGDGVKSLDVGWDENVGIVVGFEDGPLVGLAVGWEVGSKVAAIDGFGVGEFEGEEVGDGVGPLDGADVGELEGFVDGVAVVGDSVLLEGDCVGREVVGTTTPSLPIFRSGSTTTSNDVDDISTSSTIFSGFSSTKMAPLKFPGRKDSGSR